MKWYFNQRGFTPNILYYSSTPDKVREGGRKGVEEDREEGVLSSRSTQVGSLLNPLTGRRTSGLSDGTLLKILLENFESKSVP